MAEELPAGYMETRALFEQAAAKPRRIESVTVPGFGTVYVKGLTGAEYDDYEAACIVEVDGQPKNKVNRAMLLRLCVVTPNGTKVFKDEHMEMLGGLDSWMTNPIAAKAMELCGATKQAAEDMAKN